MGQEILRQQPEHATEGCDGQLPRVHPIPQDTSERADARNPSAGACTLQHHHERPCLPGATTPEPIAHR